MSDYNDLLLRIFPHDKAEQYYPVEAELADGSRFTGGRLRLDQDQLLSLQLDAEAYGRALFEALFAGDIRRAYDKATGAAEAQHGGRLRVRLWVDNEAVELHAIPWERLYHLHKGKFVPLGASTLTPLSRYTSLEIREPQPITEVPIQLLVALSNPSKLPGDLAPANVELEIENIRRSVESLCRAGQVRVTLLPGHTGVSAGLRTKLEGEKWTIIDGPQTLFNLAPHLMKAHVFHFIGHGAFRNGTAALYLEKVDGTWQAVRDEEIVNMFAALGTLPHLIFLVACESATRTAGATSPFVGLGPKLVQAGVPAVVAMQEQVPVELARALASEFYARLAEHGEVDQALNQARLQVFNKKSTEWAIPVLFMRIRKGRLFGADVDEDAPAPGEPPFKGMEYFTENDVGKFYGRELLTARLAGKLRSTRFLPIIIGSSGSGKSSVVRAGLLPALKRGEPLADGTPPPSGSEHWPIYVLTPSAHPLESLAAVLTRDEFSLQATTTLMQDLEVDVHATHQQVTKLLGHLGTSNHLVLIVDQFEEVFTLCKDERERRTFIDSLLYASAESTAGPTIVIIIFRADFYAHCAQYENLRVGVSTNQEFVGPMNPTELRRAIEEPAKAGGWEFEPGVVDLILKEVGDEPGALPLMQHALLETWKRRRGRTMTLRGYNDAGGIRGAIAKTAEAIYTTLPAEHQPIARRIFLRLVELGEGSQDTRRRARLEELWPRAADQPIVQGVLKKLVDNRLVVTTDKTAEVSHEALIREWPTIRQWIDESRDGLRLLREILTAAEDWENVNRDTGALYRGVRLAQALEWATDLENAAELGHRERAFLDASRETTEREAREKEEQRQRELLAAQQIAEEQKKRAEEQARAAQRQRRLSYVIGAVGVVAIGLAIAALLAFRQAAADRTVAVTQQNVAQSASTQAVAQQNVAQAASTQAVASAATAIAAQAIAVEKARIARAGELNVLSVAQRDQHPLLSSLLGLEAFHRLDNARTRGTLLDNLNSKPQLDRYLSQPSSVWGLAFSPDGQTLATIDYNGIILWDVVTHQPLSQALRGHTDVVRSVAFSPDGQTLASGNDDNTIILWNVATRQPIGQPLTGHTNVVFSVAFSPDGQTLASGSWDKTILLWDISTALTTNLTTRQPIGQPLTGHTDGILSVAFSPDGQTLASGSYDKTIILWNLATHQPIGQPLTGHADTVWSVAFSPDGQTLASGSDDKTIILWDAATHQPIGQPLTEHANNVHSLAFSPDGQILASGSDDKTIILWDVATRQPVRKPLIGHADSVNSVVFSPDGQTLASGSWDKTVILWDISTALNTGAATHPPLGQLLTGHTDVVRSVAFSPDGQILASGSRDQTIILWDVATRQPIGQPLNGHTNRVSNVVFSPDGQTLASGSWDKTIILWDVATRQPIGQPLTGHTSDVYSVAFSPDGQTLVSGSEDNTLILWDVATHQPLGQPLTGHSGNIYSVAFSPDGQTLASASQDKTIILWDVATRKPLGQPLTGHTDLVLSVAFSPDGQTIASGSSDNTIILWDVATRQPLGQRLSGHTNWVLNVAFSPDGQTLASGSWDQTVLLWDVATRQPIGQALRGHADLVFSVAFSPDGQTIASGGDDKTIILWNVNLQSWIEKTCQHVGRNLTLAEWEKYFPGEDYSKTCPQWPRDAGYYRPAFYAVLTKPGSLDEIGAELKSLLAQMTAEGTLAPETYLAGGISAQIDANTSKQEFEKAIRLSELAVRQGIFIPPNTFNNLCWSGSLFGYAAQVLPFCDLAVQRLANDAGFRDSRGLARVLTGDLNGAIQDFQYFVDHANVDLYAAVIEQRKQLIEQLKRGVNPITPEVLEMLKTQ